MLGDGAPTIPANGSIWIYVSQHNPPGQPKGKTPATFTLRAKTLAI